MWLRRLRVLGWVAGGAVMCAALVLALGGYFGGAAGQFTPAAVPSAHPPVAAVFWSGDMGTEIGFGSDIPGLLAARGIAVLAMSSPAVFGAGRSAPAARAAVAGSLAEALRRSGAQRVTLVGFSFGADVLAATLGQLAPGLRQRIAGVVLVGPGRDVHFHANPFGLYYTGPSEADPARMAAALRGLPVSCIYAAAEPDSFCRQPQVAGARLTSIADGHLMLAHRRAATRAVIDAVLHPPAPMP